MRLLQWLPGGEGARVYPSMYWAGVCESQYALGRWVYPSMHWPGGCLPGGCLPRWVSAHGVFAQGVSCLPRGVSAQGCLTGGGGLPRGYFPSACWDTCPPVNRMTDACENKTLRTVILDVIVFFEET